MDGPGGRQLATANCPGGMCYVSAMLFPGICDDHEVIYVHVQYRFPLARTMAFPNGPINLVLRVCQCHHLLVDEHYPNR